MNKRTLFIAIMATASLSASVSQAQNTEPKIDRVQLKEQVREAAQSEANDNTRFMNAEQHQNRIIQQQKAGATNQSMEQHQNKYQHRNQHESQTKSQSDTHRTSRYGQGYESRTRSMGTSTNGASARHGGRR